MSTASNGCDAGGSVTQGGMTLYVDYSKCIGCETCEAVCRFVHDRPRIHMTCTADGQSVPLYCRHCDNPKCQNACTRGAISQDRDSAVVFQSMLCRGCETRNCIIACPYSAMLAKDTGVAVTKCDMCAGRRDVGLQPACYETCPAGAILYVERATLPEYISEEAKAAEQRVLDHIRGKLVR